jgi:hypothetical protein
MRATRPYLFSATSKAKLIRDEKPQRQKIQFLASLRSIDDDFDEKIAPGRPRGRGRTLYVYLPGLQVRFTGQIAHNRRPAAHAMPAVPLRLFSPQRLGFPLLSDSIQHAVKKVQRLRGGVAACNLERFIDHNRNRRVRKTQ